jgi:hypothetical protein
MGTHGCEVGVIGQSHEKEILLEAHFFSPLVRRQRKRGVDFVLFVFFSDISQFNGYAVH